MHIGVLLVREVVRIQSTDAGVVQDLVREPVKYRVAKRLQLYA